MASNTPNSNAEQFIEERLIAGLLTGSFLQHKELLDLLEDVDVRYMRQKTLLHVGVGLGKTDWVEELLARGADTDITDDSQQNALSSAEEMVRQFPDDVERSKVLQLVTLVHRRDQVILRPLEASYNRSTDHLTTVASPECDIASLKSSMDSLRREMKSLVRQLSSSLDELKAQVCGRDALLRCLEEAVTSTVEDVMSVKVGLGAEASLSQPTSDPARARQECVDAMMRKTRIVYGNRVDGMRRLYERLYDEDEFTACIIKCLSWKDRVKVIVDLESNRIGRMKEEFVNLDGTRENGNKWTSYCDLESETLYFGAKDATFNYNKSINCLLARGLSQLSLKLVFNNEGKPFNKGDVERELEWIRAVEEVEERRKRGQELEWSITYALERRTQLARVHYLAASVPRIITQNGSTEGRALLQQQAPLVFSMYSGHVIRALLANTRR
ncbi:uncharacterized protein LOC124173321 [Ischnura elegans]|uniref:uncharacterized protein LOC124173321 n=1 Tax=Ischnura elegans TaxID=197161 RepID=UPI001ED88F16|nr:uncharacterized protein LOC124173321 [Ischnura elegans]